MSTLTVLMPPREAGVSPQAWQLPALRFVLADRRGRVLRSGEASLALLPKARATVLIVAARDVLLVDAIVPPLAAARLRQALPNIIEDQLLSDGPPPHIALGPAVPGLRKGASRRTLAAIDRGWLRFLHESLTAAGHRNIRAVPLVACLPMVPSAQPVAAAVAVAEAVAAAATTDDTPNMPAADAAAIASTPAGTTLDAPAAAAAAATIGTEGVAVDAEAAAAYEQAQAAEAAELAEAHVLAASATVLIVGTDDPTVLLHPQVEVAIRRLPVPPVASAVPVAERLAGEGLVVPADALTQTLGALLPGSAVSNMSTPSPGASVAGVYGDAFNLANATDTARVALSGREIYRLTGLTSAAVDAAWDERLRSLGVSAKALPFEAIAEAARTSTFDVCQFEFAAQPLRLRPGTWRQARVPLALLAASVVVAIVGLNIRWVQLVHQRDAIQSAMTGLLLDAFPRTTVVLDPAVQMRRSLDTLRVSSGELSPDDFLSLTNGLSNALGPIPATAIASIDYDRRTLIVTFRDDAKVDAGDDGFRQRLARNALDGSVDGKRWTLRSSR